MHQLENLIQNLQQLWSGKFKQIDVGSSHMPPYRISDHDWTEIGKATKAANATVPAAFGRPLDNIADDTKYFTAESYIIWLTLFAPILLRGRFQSAEVYEHLLRLVNLINQCLAFSLSGADMEQQDAGWMEWYKDYERIYYQYQPDRLSTCPLTMHSVIHIPQNIRDSGPKWANWCFQMERYCGHLVRMIASRQHPYSGLNHRIFEAEALKIVIDQFDLHDRLPAPHGRPSENPAFNRIVPGYEDYTLVFPHSTITPSNDLRNRIGTHLSTRYGIDRKHIMPVLPATVEQWGKARIGGEGDLFRSHLGNSQGKRSRDATFVRYELLVDKHMNNRRLPPEFVPTIFYGQVQRIFVLVIPSNSTLGTQAQPATTLVLADICPVDTDNDASSGPIPRFKRFKGRLEVIDISCVHSVVGRIFDRGAWHIIERPGGIKHALFSAEEDLSDADVDE
ncbi:hypothetical protein BOTBODRAFT_99767 [Botryobasidium botryosum FD-172 SS1]|uniref:Uncharacterized protein n=1 Tax=Botryobasidium botryosum (strain FD-172 SS1) TaxID=930990 RepID=A0A067NDR7_BOTB1|nr:hypothetical protein BOTBODRAFT_99767 [Botryobasidium botryosum FD-172 SS1]